MSGEYPNDMPNCLHVSGERSYHCHFGSVARCDPVNLAGAGHWPHVVALFKFGLKLELDRATAVELARRLTESVAALPFLSDSVHDAILDGDT